MGFRSEELYSKRLVGIVYTSVWSYNAPCLGANQRAQKHLRVSRRLALPNHKLAPHQEQVQQHSTRAFPTVGSPYLNTSSPTIKRSKVSYTETFGGGAGK